MTTFPGITEPGFIISEAQESRWDITLTESCSNDLVHRLIRATRTNIQTHGKPSSILIDLTHSNPVSLVCISNLVDSLTRNKIKIAAIFNDEEQHALAQLIHYTLPYREYVEYFTDRQQALNHLQPTTDQ